MVTAIFKKTSKIDNELHKKVLSFCALEGYLVSIWVSSRACFHGTQNERIIINLLKAVKKDLKTPFKILLVDQK